MKKSQETRDKRQDTGYRRQETRDKRQDTGYKDKSEKLLVNGYQITVNG